MTARDSGRDGAGGAGFGALLRRYRGAAGMTQEALADRSGLSEREIRRLERGKGERHTPRPSTVAYLAGALGLSDRERRAFEEAALRSPEPSASGRPSLQQAGDLTEPLTPLVGREGLVEEAAGLLGRGEIRLLTLVGPGGVGKTRVGLRVAAELRSRFADGAAFVGLATAAEPALVALAVARAVGLEESGGRPAAEKLADHLREKEMLLFLDNFEQVRAAAPLLVGLLSGCPGLKALVTSRAALRVRGEQELAVPPLDLPGPSPAGGPRAEELAGSPAVTLFVERARASDPSFGLDDGNAQEVAGICRHLDGLPLALELAASRVSLLPPGALLSRLEGFSDLSLLTGGGQDMPERQRTMRRTIEWSHELLGEDEKILFRRLAVFSGGFTPEAAEAVCPDGGRESQGVLDGISALAGASLLWRRAGSTGEARLGMLGTIREYARERLAASGEDGAVRGRHAAYNLALAEEAEPRLRGPEHAAWLDRLEREHDNLRAALAWARESEDVETGLRLAGALGMFWWTRGHLLEGRRWTEAALEAARSGDAPADALAAASHAAGQLAFGHGDSGSATARLESALDLYRELEDGAGTAATLVELGQALRALGETDRAAALSEEGLAASRALGDVGNAAVALNTLGQVARDRGQAELSAALHEEALSCFAEAGERRGQAYTLGRLGILALERGEVEAARELHEESLELYEDLKDRAGLAYALVNLGDAMRATGDEGRGRSLYREALALHRDLGNERGTSRALERLASADGTA